MRWITPREGEMKINWDATFDPKSKMIGAGVIIRDTKGEVLAVLSSPISNISIPALAKVNALWRAMQLGAR